MGPVTCRLKYLFTRRASEQVDAISKSVTVLSGQKIEVQPTSDRVSKLEAPAGDYRLTDQPLALLRASFWLALILVVTKAFSGHIDWWPGFPARLLTLVASSWSDVLFALAWGVFGVAVTLMLRRWRRMAALAHGVLLALFTLFALYAVAAIALFRHFNRPLTYDLVWLINTVSVAALQSSIEARLTVPIVVALILVPIVFLALSIRIQWSRYSTVIALGIAVSWVGSGLLLHGSGWEKSRLEFLALSPHNELLRTAALRLIDWRRIDMSNDFPAEYVKEFRTFGARGVSQKEHFQLPPGVARPRNAIVVVLESVGTKYLGLYGAQLDVTPTLSAEARHALVFENIYAHASFTYASFRGINFSVYPGLPGRLMLVGGGGDAHPVPQTLAGRMKERGARTAYISSGNVHEAGGSWLLTHRNDFDVVEGASELKCPIHSSWGVEDRCAFDRLVQWVDEKPNQPFFAIVWTNQAHDPHVPSAGSSPIHLSPDKMSSPFAADLVRYLQVVRDTDAQLARVFAALRARGLADDTLVIVTGDHGTAFADPHGQRGHAQSVYEEEIRIPFMIWNPRLFPVGRRSETIGGHVDLNPTVADLMNVEPPRAWQGHSLFHPAHPNRAYFLAMTGRGVFGVREANWKYDLNITTGRESLFDLATDPDEQYNVSARQSEHVQRLRQRVAAWASFQDAFFRGQEK